MVGDQFLGVVEGHVLPVEEDLGHHRIQPAGTLACEGTLDRGCLGIVAAHGKLDQVGVGDHCLARVGSLGTHPSWG